MTIVSTKAIKEAIIDIASDGDNVVIAGSEGKVIRVRQIFLVAASSTELIVKSGDTALTGPLTLASLVLDVSEMPWFTTGEGESFVLNLGDAVQCSGRVYYTEN